MPDIYGIERHTGKVCVHTYMHENRTSSIEGGGCVLPQVQSTPGRGGLGEGVEGFAAGRPHRLVRQVLARSPGLCASGSACH